MIRMISYKLLNELNGSIHVCWTHLGSIQPSLASGAFKIDLLSPRAQRLKRGRANKEPRKARKGLIRES